VGYYRVIGFIDVGDCSPAFSSNANLVNMRLFRKYFEKIKGNSFVRSWKVWHEMSCDFEMSVEMRKGTVL
jgi:hypothetical protein